ncbi:hypothetical protein QRD43_12380 [Pelomonas sp. APW6]|uniref:DUF4132 domain-containing protein n=1 Tax=Roseateles subflavus TaxID=3053353 RepID=A0ABT7LIR0_9BURK|nr:hypothetical protein [Pelomonas sp. APW6]MDL5032703.1 hypothetical protein [Pelomonas sp. APW6]
MAFVASQHGCWRKPPSASRVNTEFLKPRLVGKRFDAHSIPVEVLKDWAAFEGLIVEVARWLYLEQFPRRKRTPRGFTQNFSIHLTQVESGSAVPVLERPLPQGSLVHDAFSEWFDKARDRVLDTIDAASKGQSVDDLLPKPLLAYFDQFGRFLREDERVEFTRATAANDVVVYDNRVRKTLVLKSATVYRTEESVRGSMSELNMENKTFTLKLISGEKVTGYFSEELRDAAHSALGAYGESLVMVEGAVVRDQSDSRKRIEQVTRIEPLDALDVPARLESLALLRDGWMDGQGLRPSPSGLAWLSKAWTDAWPDEAALPYAYPTPEGGVQFEWSTAEASLSAELDLNTRVAEVLVSRTADGEVLEEARLELDKAEQWEALAGLVQRYTEAQNGTA